VLRIHDIFVLIRIRILDPDSSIFVIDLQDANKKNNFVKKISCLLLFEGAFTSFSKIKSQKESQNSRNQGFSYYFCMMVKGYLWLMDSDPDRGGSKTYGSDGSGFATLLRTVQSSYVGRDKPVFFLFRWSACPSSSRRLTVARCATTGPGAQCPSAFPPSAPSCRIRPATAWLWRPIWITAWSADSSAGESSFPLEDFSPQSKE
jgi:hypothetical protein